MIRYSKRGQKYVERVSTYQHIQYSGDGHSSHSHTTRGVLSEDGDRPNVSLFANLSTIEQYYGKGVRSYFSYVNFMILMNFIFLICGAVSWGLYMKDKSPTQFELQDFFITNYKQTSEIYWFWTNITMFVLYLTYPIIYYAVEKLISKKKLDEYTGNSDGEENDTIWENDKKRTMYVLSITLTLFVIAVTTTIFFGLLLLEKNLILKFGNVLLFDKISLSVTFNFVISFVFVFLNGIWKSLSFKLTNLENNQTWSAYRISQAFKLISFKLISAISLFTLTPFILDPLNSCIETQNAENFFFIVVMDAFFINFVAEICLPLITRAVRKGLRLEEKEKPEFNISEELQQLFYRQLILNIAFIVFPMISAIGFLGLLCQYLFDRIKFKYVCSDTHYVEQSFVTFLVICSSILGLLTLITFPNGGLWMLFLPKLLPIGYQNCTMTGAIDRLFM